MRACAERTVASYMRAVLRTLAQCHAQVRCCTASCCGLLLSYSLVSDIFIMLCSCLLGAIQPWSHRHCRRCCPRVQGTPAQP